MLWLQKGARPAEVEREKKRQRKRELGSCLPGSHGRVVFSLFVLNIVPPSLPVHRSPNSSITRNRASAPRMICYTYDDQVTQSFTFFYLSKELDPVITRFPSIKEINKRTNGNWEEVFQAPHPPRKING